MDSVNNNQFEVVPAKSKRKIATPCPNAYLNPALDILANEDRMCNTAMEITQPIKKRKRTRSCGDIATFDNSALDLGANKATVNKLLAREIENVRKNVRYDATEDTSMDSSEPIYANLTVAPQLPPRNDNSITFQDSCHSNCAP